MRFTLLPVSGVQKLVCEDVERHRRIEPHSVRVQVPEPCKRWVHTSAALATQDSLPTVLNSEKRFRGKFRGSGLSTWPETDLSSPTRSISMHAYVDPAQAARCRGHLHHAGCRAPNNCVASSALQVREISKVSRNQEHAFGGATSKA
eukprot:6194156-Pleurochrysis_carterae.AAC.1